MSQHITFCCPGCNRDFNAEQDLAGDSFNCSRCSTQVTVPAVSTSLALTPRADSRPETWTEAWPDTSPEAPLEPVVEPHDLPLAPRRKRRASDTKPVEMRLPYQLGGMTVEVDRKTGNSMAMTFLGGLLVAIGAVIVFILGGKRSA